MQAHAITVVESLYYLDRVRELMSDVPRPTGQSGVLSEAELRAMRTACAAGDTPAAFVARVLEARDVEYVDAVRERTAWATAAGARFACS